MSTISYYRGQEIDRLKTVNYQQAQEIDRLKTVNHQHIFDRNQLLETNELLREQIADLKRDLREANARLASKEIDEIIYRHLQQCAS